MNDFAVYVATGHRPDKLFCLDRPDSKGLTYRVYRNGGLERLRDLARVYLVRQLELMGNRPIVAISGLALGWDTAYAWAAIELGIYLVAAVPCATQANIWGEEDRQMHAWILERADEVQVLAETYDDGCMERRNRWMLDKCQGDDDRVVALWNKTRGGTGNAVSYAQSRGLVVHNVWGSWLKGVGNL